MSDILSIKGRVAVVTGASSGNGRAIALLLASNGASVVCSDLTPNVRSGGYESSTVPTHETITQAGGNSVFFKADASSESDIKALIDLAVKQYGRLDIMVNNAGIFTGMKTIAEETMEDFDKTMAVNTRGTFLGIKYAIIQMMKQDPLASGERGWIVNIASIGGQVGLALEPSYCASKGAVVNLTRQVAIDYAEHKIHVNAVCPGFLTTAMVRSSLENSALNERLHKDSPWPHLGTAEDVAKAVLVLASDAASWMTGGMVQVDGGFIAK